MATRYTPRVSTSRDDDEGDDVSHFPETKTSKREEESSIGGEKKKKNEARERRFQR